MISASPSESVSKSYRVHAREEAAFLARLSRPQRLRTMAEFAESELVIPDGEFEGHRYKLDRQPVARLWFQEIDSGRWNRFAGTGPQQSGKSLSFYIIPALYHLFEMQETVICGIPSMDMARDKWEIDLKPAIEASRYRDLLPTKGQGSRSGSTPGLITFKNGARLKFMSGGGGGARGDAKTSAFTSRVLVVTEADKLDEASAQSREADPLRQMEGRTRSFDKRRRIYLECTVSTEQGRIWQEIKAGSDSRLVLPCHSCGDWVAPERDHLVGWDSAATEYDADDGARFSCPSCGILWSEDDRERANLQAKLLHKGQEIDRDGTVRGDVPKTRTLGFRYSAVNNLFVSAGTIGADEWRARRSENPENSDRELCQWTWVVPPRRQNEDIINVDVEDLLERTHDAPMNVAPDAGSRITIGMDVGKRTWHWVAMSHAPTGVSRVIAYGEEHVPHKKMSLNRAFEHTLRHVSDHFESVFECDGGILQPAKVLIDARYKPEFVTDAIRSVVGKAVFTANYVAAMGHGRNQDYSQSRYKAPTSKSSSILAVHDHYYVEGHRQYQAAVVHMDSDWWKSQLYQLLINPIGESANTLTLYRPDSADEHVLFANHLTNERQVEKDGPLGRQIVWERHSRLNHWLDAAYMALVARQIDVDHGRKTAASRRTQSQPEEKPRDSPWINRIR